MEDWQKRVLHEEQELSKKLIALCSYIETDNFKKLDKSDRDLLLLQETAMAEYLVILGERISRF